MRSAQGVPSGYDSAPMFKWVLVGLVATTVIGPAEAQDLDEHTPRGALWRAAAVPGWGQYYNEQYFKIPIVWAGLAGLTASALYVNQRYVLNRHAYHYAAGVNTSPEYEQDFLQLIDMLDMSRETGLQYDQGFRQRRDILRRNRDLLYIGIGLFYGLTILDAYVNAHLLDFDVGEDLSLSVQAAPAGVSASLRLRP